MCGVVARTDTCGGEGTEIKGAVERERKGYMVCGCSCVRGICTCACWCVFID